MSSGIEKTMEETYEFGKPKNEKLETVEIPKEGIGHVDAHHSQVLADRNLMNDAFDGENLEHSMSMWAAVKTHPWACLWAFTMSFTIVSFVEPIQMAIAVHGFPI